MRIAFGPFTMDTDARRLFRAAAEIRVSPKAFDLLTLLVVNRPKALTKDALFTQLWPDTFVTENNLATLVADLRAALGDDAQHPQFIRTVYAYGYAFAADATIEETRRDPPVAPLSGWRLVHDYREIPLQAGENIVGRSGPGVVVLDSPAVSKHHARLSVAGNRATVQDLGSKNGTWVGITRVTAAAVPLNDGDELRLGSVVVVVRFGSPASSTETIERARP